MQRTDFVPLFSHPKTTVAQAIVAPGRSQHRMQRTEFTSLGGPPRLQHLQPPAALLHRTKRRPAASLPSLSPPKHPAEGAMALLATEGFRATLHERGSCAGSGHPRPITYDGVCAICLDSKPVSRMLRGSFCGGFFDKGGDRCGGSVVCKLCARKSIDVQLKQHGALHAGRVPPTLHCPICPGRRLLPLRRARELLGAKNWAQFELGAKSALRFFCGSCHGQREMLVHYSSKSLEAHLAGLPGMHLDPEGGGAAALAGLLTPLRKRFCAGGAGAVDALLGVLERVAEAARQDVAWALAARMESAERRAVWQLAFLRRWPRFRTNCCRSEHCFGCHIRGWHTGKTCAAYQAAKNPGAVAVVSCPKCNVQLVKGDGCSSVRCPCGHAFNWHEREKQTQREVALAFAHRVQAEHSALPSAAAVPPTAELSYATLAIEALFRGGGDDKLLSGFERRAILALGGRSTSAEAEHEAQCWLRAQPRQSAERAAAAPFEAPLIAGSPVLVHGSEHCKPAERRCNCGMQRWGRRADAPYFAFVVQPSAAAAAVPEQGEAQPPAADEVVVAVQHGEMRAVRASSWEDARGWVDVRPTGPPQQEALPRVSATRLARAASTQLLCSVRARRSAGRALRQIRRALSKAGVADDGAAGGVVQALPEPARSELESAVLRTVQAQAWRKLHNTWGVDSAAKQLEEGIERFASVTAPAVRFERECEARLLGGRTEAAALAEAATAVERLSVGNCPDTAVQVATVAAQQQPPTSALVALMAAAEGDQAGIEGAAEWLLLGCFGRAGAARRKVAAEFATVWRHGGACSGLDPVFEAATSWCRVSPGGGGGGERADGQRPWEHGPARTAFAARAYLDELKAVSEG